MANDLDTLWDDDIEDRLAKLERRVNVLKRELLIVCERLDALPTHTHKSETVVIAEAEPDVTSAAPDVIVAPTIVVGDTSEPEPDIVPVPLEEEPPELSEEPIEPVAEPVETEELPPDTEPRRGHFLSRNVR